MGDGGMRCVKYLIFIFNLLFCIMGILVIIGGALIMTVFREAVTWFGEWTSWIGVTAICVGVIIFVISFLGCCGARYNSYCLIITFAVVLGLILSVEVGCIVAGLVMKGRLKTSIEEHLLRDLRKYGPSDEVTVAWDIRQNDVECCGVSNYANWIESEYMRNNSFSVPGSCCIVNGCNTSALATASEDHARTVIRTTGCFEAVIAWARKNIGIFLGIAVALAIVQIVGIILASCLALHARRKDEFV